MLLSFKRTNTILYCKNWSETVAFYRHRLQLPVTFASDWFVEFRLTETAYLSIADERRATIRSSRGTGLTLTLQVADVEKTWQWLAGAGLTLEPIKEHPWGAHVFYFYDPEGHRLEIWAEREILI